MARKKAGTLPPVGKTIHKIRTTKKISYDTLANETGFAIDYIKQIESGKVTPPVGALLSISRALEIDSGQLLKEEEDRKVDRVKAYTKRTRNYAYTSLTPGAENKHIKAFRVTVGSQQQHEGVGYQHEGEEFVYVLQGQVEVQVGEHVNKLKAGDSLHFNSNIRHQMRNPGDTPTEMIVVVYSP